MYNVIIIEKIGQRCGVFPSVEIIFFFDQLG